MRNFLSIIGAAIVGLLVITVPLVRAETTAPQRIVYNGHLLDSSGNAVTSEVEIRFSYWNSADHQSGDITGAGAINTSATAYLDWYEEHTVTPNADGYFTVELGSNTALPDFSAISTADLLSMYMMVEVKDSAAADTAYEVLDKNPDDDTDDRAPVRSVPFALNSNLIDRREVGTGSGNIAYLGSGGYLTQAGTLNPSFVLDADGAAAGNITLTFGAALSKTLLYSQSNSRFEFNDDVNIAGDLTVTGLVNGIDISQITNDVQETHLAVTSGAALTINVSAGDYQLAGSGTRFAGDSGLSVADDATNYVFFGSGGVVVNTIGFPVNESYIPLAAVTTEAGVVKTITDRRVLNADNRQMTVEHVFHPEYANVSYQGDTTNNVGQLYVDTDTTNKKNFYRWSSTQSTLQDYDMYIPFTLPDDWVSWKSTALEVDYRSTSADTANSKLDIAVFDTNGSPISITGTNSDLANTSWTTASLGLDASATYTPGQDIMIKLTVYSKDNFQMQLGKIRLLYTEFHDQDS